MEIRTSLCYNQNHDSWQPGDIRKKGTDSKHFDLVFQESFSPCKWKYFATIVKTDANNFMKSYDKEVVRIFSDTNVDSLVLQIYLKEKQPR